MSGIETRETSIPSDRKRSVTAGRERVGLFGSGQHRAVVVCLMVSGGWCYGIDSGGGGNYLACGSGLGGAACRRSNQYSAPGTPLDEWHECCPIKAIAGYGNGLGPGESRWPRRALVKIQVQNKWSAVALILIALVAVASIVVPVPFVTRSPGPVFDVLGDIDGEPVLEIKGAKSYPTSGRLDMTTVSEVGGAGGSLNVVSAVIGLFDADSSVVPAGERYPNGAPTEEDREAQQKVFAASQSTALAAAADYVGRPVTSQAVVFDVVPDSPADGILQAADVIESVNGETVDDGRQVGEIVSVLPTGSSVVFRILRDGAAMTQNVTTRSVPVDPENPEGRQKSVVGILVDNHYESDFRAVVSLDDIGGPSAGLVFSMAMVDHLQKADMFDGRHVAGTGTILADGAVGPIGGIDKKMSAAADAGAGLFLAPHGNCEDVAVSVPEGLTVVPVDSLAEAIQSTRDWLAGRELATCLDAADATHSGKNS